MTTVNKELVDAWSQLGIGLAALLVLLLFLIAAFLLLMRAIKAFTDQQKTNQISQLKLAESLHELAEATQGYRVQLVEVKATIDNVAREQTEIKVDQRYITEEFKKLSSALATALTPEIKVALAPYFKWQLEQFALINKRILESMAKKVS